MILHELRSVFPFDITTERWFLNLWRGQVGEQIVQSTAQIYPCHGHIIGGTRIVKLPTVVQVVIGIEHI